MEKDVTLDPIDVSLLGSNRVMFELDDLPDLVQQPFFWVGNNAFLTHAGTRDTSAIAFSIVDTPWSGTISCPATKAGVKCHHAAKNDARSAVQSLFDNIHAPEIHR